MKLYSCKGKWKDGREFEDMLVSTGECDEDSNDDLDDDEVFYYTNGDPVLGDHGDFVIAFAERIHPVIGLRSYLKMFDIYLPATDCHPSEYCETIEIECYTNYTDYEFIASESSQLIDNRTAYHWDKKYGKIK